MDVLVCDGRSGGGAMRSRWLNKVWYGEMPPCEDVRSETFASTRVVRDVGPFVRDEARVK